MKKLLLGAALCLGAFGNASAIEWAVIGDFNDWQESTAMAMTEQSENVYTITIPSLKGDFKFIGDRSWDYNFGASNWTQVTGNGTVKVASFGGNFQAPETVENITITLDTGKQLVSFSGLSTDMDVPSLNETIYKPGHYIIGDPAGVWDPAVGIPMTEVEENVFEWTGYIFKGQYFAFTKTLVESAPNPWAALKDYRYGRWDGEDSPAYTGDLILEPGETIGVIVPPYDDTSWTLEETGRYTITIDDNAGTLTCSENTLVWGVCGEYNGWGADEEDATMTVDEDGIWSVELRNFSGEFKLRANNEWNLNVGSVAEDAEEVKVDSEYQGDYNGRNFFISSPIDHIRLSYDPSTFTLTAKIPTQIETIAISADTADTPIYYNMQGIRVENPKEGLFIRIKGEKAEKVRL